MATSSKNTGRFRFIFVVIATMLVGIIVVLPMAVGSVYDDYVQPPEGDIYTLDVAPGVPPAPTNSRLHVAITGLDELRLRATLRASGSHSCRPACDFINRVVFFSLGTNESATAGMPPSASVDLPPDALVVTQSFDLPMRGNPTRYPFDVYEMWLAVGMSRVYPDGRTEALNRSNVDGHLFVTLQEQLARENMGAPEPMDPDVQTDIDQPYPFLVLDSLRFERPLYIRILAVLLVLLIAAAASYAVFMRPLQDLVVNAGGLVLGVWGIRAILIPSTINYLTVVDLSLSLVILFLLGAITVRALQFSHARSDLPTLLPTGRAGAADPASETAPEDQCDFAGCKNAIAQRCSSCKRAYCPRHVSGGVTPICDACADQSITA